MFNVENTILEGTNSGEYLEYLLNLLGAKPELKDEVTQIVESVFGQDKAVMILDMSGFCRKTQSEGIVQVLSIIFQMRNIIQPFIEADNGKLIKSEADNLFCIFDSVSDAICASRNINEFLAERNKTTDEDCQLFVSIGIGYGQILNIENRDLFGNEVNLASKLSEDIGCKGDILLTQNALDQLKQTETIVLEKTIEISGVSLNYHLIS
ncbi:hypothetical protein BH20ACI4_BH20ACI4_00960 [soil metagenome]